MKIKLMVVCLLFSTFIAGQSILKGANIIKIKGATFKEAGQALIEYGFSFEMIDSNFNTIRTIFRESSKNKGAMERYFVSVKDSVITLRGEWYLSNLVGMNAVLVNKKLTVDDLTSPIDYTGNKKVFNEMNTFALSFNKPVEYIKQ